MALKRYLRLFGLLLALAPMNFGLAKTSHSKMIFSDIDLQNIFKKSKLEPKELFVIYSWSPHMNLSILGLETIATQKNVVILVDPRANPSLAKKTALKLNFDKAVLIRNQSRKLQELGALTHYPNYIFIKNGQFLGGLLPGYKSAPALQRYIALSSRKGP